jgi:hypothetical protein
MRTEKPAVYTVKVSVAGNAQGTDSFTIPKGFDFYLMEMVHKRTGAADLDSVTVLKENLIEGGSCPIELIAGDGVRRQPLAKEFLCPGGQTVTLTATDKSGAANVIDVAFHGVLRYPEPGEG